MTHKIILASGSEGRKQQLTRAGIAFDIKKPDVDEEAIALEHLKKLFPIRNPIILCKTSI